MRADTSYGEHSLAGFCPPICPRHDLQEQAFAASPIGRNIFLPPGYDGGMTVRKLSISVPAEVEETIKAAAAEEGKPVSAWLAEAATEKARAAAQHAAGRGAARELVAEYEAEHGPLPEASRRRARQFLLETGLIDDEP